MPTCPKCGKFVKREESMCPYCGFQADFEQMAREDDARRKALYGLKSSEEEAASAREAQIRREAASMPVVTLHHFPGRKIEKVVGVVTAEVVLGTGLITEMSTAFADLLGTRGTEFEAKWREAKEAALDELRRNAREMGCNAVLGVDMELATVRDIPMIIVTGTGVVLGEE